MGRLTFRAALSTTAFVTADAETIPLAAPPAPLVYGGHTWRERIPRLVRVLRRKQGEVASDSPPANLVIEARGVRIRPRKVARFRSVCSYDAHPGFLPLTYPVIPFSPLLREALLAEGFPLAVFGLIHVRQQIHLLRPIPDDATVDLRGELAALRRTSKGLEVDFALELRYAGAPAWTGTTTLLSRSEEVRDGQTRSAKRPPEPPSPDEYRIVRVPANTGRRYARVAGDYNPHHLSAITARPLGYKSAIAHGLWSLARAAGVVLREAPKDRAIHVDVSFKRPIFLPGKIAISDKPLSATNPDVPLEVRDPKTGAPHVIGTAKL
jgi:acyl dehydratase